MVEPRPPKRCRIPSVRGANDRKNWTDAYVRKENRAMARRPELLTAIAIIVARMEHNTKNSPTGYLLAGTDKEHAEISWPKSNLELAGYLWKSAPYMQGELAQRMKNLALKLDLDFHRLPHKLNAGGGFVATVDSRTGQSQSRSMNRPYITTWISNYGQRSHARTANLCFRRFEQLEKSHPALAEKYKRLLLSAANIYLNSAPAPSDLVKPKTVAHVITLMIDSYRITGEKNILSALTILGTWALACFLTMVCRCSRPPTNTVTMKALQVAAFLCIYYSIFTRH